MESGARLADLENKDCQAGLVSPGKTHGDEILV